MNGEETKFDRMPQLRRGVFVNHGFTQGCPGCQASSHCMQQAIRSSPEGQVHVSGPVSSTHPQFISRPLTA